MTPETEHSHSVEPARFCVETPDGFPTDEPEWLTLPEIIQAYPALAATYPHVCAAGLDKIRLLAPGESYYCRDLDRTFSRPKRVRVIVAIDVDCIYENDVPEAVNEALEYASDMSHAASVMDVANVAIL